MFHLMRAIEDNTLPKYIAAIMRKNNGVHSSAPTIKKDSLLAFINGLM